MNSVATEQLWIDFGLDSAVFLDYIAHWLHLNSSNRQPRNFHDNRYWTYNTLDTLHSIFPGWPKETIRNIIRKCVKKGLLLVSNYNKKKYDRTNWYSLSDLAISYYPKLSHLIQQMPDNPGGVSCGDFTAPCGKSTAAIPNISTTSSNIYITISDSDESPAIVNAEIVEAYHEVLPDCPKIKVIDTKLKTQLKNMRNNWPNYQKEGKKFSIQSFKDYLNYIKQHYPWFIKPYTTENGNIKRNGLRVLTREINITKIVNGEFSGK